MEAYLCKVENREPNYLDELNDVQRQAVLQTNGPVMIIAGAGSGKTRVLTYRIAHLMAQGIEPYHILALTFTNKAAREMRERIERVAGPAAHSLWMGTFHSIFSKILRIEADKLGYPQNFTIYDTDDAKSLIKSILKEFNLDEKTYKPGMVYSRISSLKNNLISAAQYESMDDYIKEDLSRQQPHFQRVFLEYSIRCFRAGAMDFDDLLVKTHELLNKFPEVLHRYQHKFQYVMVDEFQDTNHCQYAIIRKLAAMRENICVVGDDAQSIYAFRGATIKNILNFERDYPDLRVFKLEQNYRSTSTIVAAAGTIIKHNKEQLKKKVWTQNAEGEKIKLLQAATDNEEGKIISEIILDEKLRHQRYNKEFAVLYRTNAQSRAFEEALRRQNIPYRVYGGTSFYQRKEIKDAVAYLRLVINPHDEEALKRIINYPARGIGKTTVDRLVLAANTNKCSIWTVLENIEQIKAFGSAIGKLAEFRNMIMSFMTKNQAANAFEVAMEVMLRSRLLQTLKEDRSVEGMSRQENINELLNGLNEFSRDDTNAGEKTLDVYLQDIALLTDADDQKDPNADVVKLMTIHASKGLEFPVVFIVGLEENLFPSQLSLHSKSDLEEERRLFYVATTRAEQKLVLSYASSRFKYGTLHYAEPSRFIREIDPILIEANVGRAKETYTLQFPEKPKANLKPMSLTSKQLNAFKFTPRQDEIPDDFKACNPEDIKEMQEIEHPRFGRGKVLSIEGIGDGRKAAVDFEEHGFKQIILRYARLKIIG